MLLPFPIQLSETSVNPSEKAGEEKQCVRLWNLHILPQTINIGSKMHTKCHAQKNICRGYDQICIARYRCYQQNTNVIDASRKPYIRIDGVSSFEPQIDRKF